MTASSQEQLRRFATAALNAAGVRHVVPTPLDAVAEAVRLTPASDLQIFSERPSARLAMKLERARRKVRGFLAAREKIVWVDDRLRESQQRFVLAHEIGHEVIPWQRDAYMVDRDAELTPETRDAFEVEANSFASELLFNIDDFTLRGLEGPLSLSTPLGLSAEFAASLIASSRRFVEEHPAACALLVLGRYETRSMGRPAVKLLYGVQSQRFEERFGPLMRGLRLPSAWPHDWHDLARDAHAAVKGYGFDFSPGVFSAPTGDVFSYEVFAACPYPFALLVPKRRLAPLRGLPEVKVIDGVGTDAVAPASREIAW